MLVDHSALEVFANGRALSARVYPTRSDATGLSVAAHAGAVEVDQVDVWTMADVWRGPRNLCP